jgi:hypothetical protein
MDEEALDALLKNLTGAAVPPPSVQLHNTPSDRSVRTLINDNITGLLTQSELTPQQVELLSLLLYTATLFHEEEI